MSAFLRERSAGYRAELSHAKLVLDGNCRSEAKLYLVLGAEGARLGQLAPVAQVRARAAAAQHAASTRRAVATD